MQLGFGGISTLILFIVYIVYFPLDPQSDSETVDDRKRQHFRAKLLLIGVLLIWAVLSIIGIALHFWLLLPGDVVGAYGKVVGILSAIIVVFQWSPQIYTTWKLGVRSYFMHAKMFP